MSKLQIIHLFPFQQKIARKSKDWQICCFSVQKMPHLLTKYRKFEQKSKQFQKITFSSYRGLSCKIKTKNSKEIPRYRQRCCFLVQKMPYILPKFEKIGQKWKNLPKITFPTYSGQSVKISAKNSKEI